MSTLAGIVTLAAAISTVDLRDEFPIAPTDAVVVQDAIARWNDRTRGGRSDMFLRVPIVVHLPRQRCVVLRLRVPAVGGENPPSATASARTCSSRQQMTLSSCSAAAEVIIGHLGPLESAVTGLVSWCFRSSCERRDGNRLLFGIDPCYASRRRAA